MNAFQSATVDIFNKILSYNKDFIRQLHSILKKDFTLQNDEYLSFLNILKVKGGPLMEFPARIQLLKNKPEEGFAYLNSSGYYRIRL